MIVLICGQLIRHPLIKLYHFFNLLQMLMTAEWLILSSLATSCLLIVVRGLASMIALN